MKKDLSRTEKTLGLILAAVVGLGAVAAVAMPMMSKDDECTIMCWCFAKPGNRWLTCGTPE